MLYFDDEIERPGRDAQKIKELLEVPGEFEIDLRFPPQHVSDLPSSPPDVLLVDFVINTALRDGQHVDYYGSTLASEMRMRHPSCLIVLVTRPENFRMNETKMQLLEESVDVDAILLKDDIYTSPEEQRAKIEALASGFKALDTIKNQSWSSVLGIMRADKQEADNLREAGPPMLHKRWNVPKTARWIRNVVMGFPGILYDDLTAATRLGISLDAFRSSSVQKLVEDAKYDGVFSTYQERWWRDRLFNIAQKLMLKHEVRGVVSQKFAEAFRIDTGGNLSLATCIFDETPIADWICYVLKKPVKQQNSIPYYPDSRPSVMDQARVSFKAIQESSDFDESLVDADGLERVEKLWR